MYLPPLLRAGRSASFFLLAVESMLALLTGASISRILHREKRRRIRRETAAVNHDARCLEKDPELAGR